MHIPHDSAQFPLDHNNLLLKGSVVRNTGHAFGLAVYTGKNTKLFKNLKKGKTKFSFLDSRLNQLMVGLLLVHQTLSILYVIVSSVLQTKVVSASFYLPKEMQTNGTAFYVFSSYLTAFILLNLFIPMSLFVSLEFVKGLQIKFMEADKYLRDEFGRGMKANTSNLNSDLSQIEIIFSDKTGTLTENKMVFKIAATRSGFVHDEQVRPGGLFHVVTSRPTKNNDGSAVIATGQAGDTGIMEHPLSVVPGGDAQRASTDGAKLDANADADAGKQQHGGIMPFSETDQYWVHELMLNVAINNMITPHTDEKTGQVKLEGESPDEVALLKAAFANGYRLINRTDESIEVDVCGKRMLYKLMATMKFDSDRKRMSVLVEEIPLDASGRPIPDGQLSDDMALQSASPASDASDELQGGVLKRAQSAGIDNSGADGASARSPQSFAFIKDAQKAHSRIICYSKGADSVLMRLLSSKERESGADRRAIALVDEYAREGLRTLLFCRRELDKNEFTRWIRRLKAAEVSSDANRDSKIAQLYEEVETGFEIIGLTAIEDRLQDRVPETISFFRDAGVQLWMLTGDKRETAINIGYSANLLDRDTTEVHIVEADTLKKCTHQLQQTHKHMTTPNSKRIAPTSTTSQQGGKPDNSLVIDGNSLGFVFGNHPALKRQRAALDGKMIVGKVVETGKRVRRNTVTMINNLQRRRRSAIGAPPQGTVAQAVTATAAAEHHEQHDHHAHGTSSSKGISVEARKKQLAKRQKACFKAFLEVIPHCRTVIVCRATPLQKALMVRLMKRKFNKIGLAIGDGANDVSMIQEARVGVGIMGLEGSQASRASDYSIHRFHHLVRLLAVHGRYSMIRTGLFVQYSFYKNMVITVIMILFTAFNLVSGQTFLDSWLLTFYNLIFTLLTPFVMGLFEIDVDDKVLMRKPEIFRRMRRESILDYRSFAWWVLSACYHAAVIFFWMIMGDMTSGSILVRNGWSSDMWTVSTAASLCVNMVVNLKSVLEMSKFHALNIFSVLFSILSLYTFQFLYAIIIINPIDSTGNIYYVTFELFASGKFHLLCLFIVVTCLLPDFAMKYLRKLFVPKPSEVEQIRFVKEQRRKMWQKLTRRGKKQSVAAHKTQGGSLQHDDEPIRAMVDMDAATVDEASMPRVAADLPVDDSMRRGIDGLQQAGDAAQSALMQPHDAGPRTDDEESVLVDANAGLIYSVDEKKRTMVMDV